VFWRSRLGRHGFLFLFPLLLCVLCASARADDARSFTECTHCPVMMGIPAGRFVMGSPKSEPGRFDAEGPQHIVSVGAFALGKYDVTSEQYQIFLQETGYQPEPCNKITGMRWRVPSKGYAYPPTEVEPPKWPAVCLDWKDAQAYIAWLNRRVRAEHPSIAYKPGGPYRLPSEAEWEYAARAGTTTARWWGDEIGAGNANCNGCGSKYDFHVLADVDAFRPNAFGLYGMLGNAWEWTADCWHPSYVGAPKNGSAWISGGDCSKHVIRGGSWDNTPIFIRSATRSGSTPNGGEFDYSSLAGFRVARDLP
jgi:formylglycine-generating enzyme required for sulfatase activity